jgi:hypothetical protein
MATSQRFDLVGIFPTDSEFPIRHQFIAMKFYPCLHQAQLLTGQFTRKNFTISEGNGRLELGLFGVNVRQVVVLIVDQVQADDDAVEHGNDGHVVLLVI